MSKTTRLTERPIIFTAESVQSILEGRKRQTRRAILDVPDGVESITSIPHVDRPGYFQVVSSTMPRYAIKCRYGAAGDRVWVKEGWTHYGNVYHHDHSESHVQYADGTRRSTIVADPPSRTFDGWRLARSPLFMPRWASRLTLEITALWAQRVQDIREADAVAEGCESNDWIMPVGTRGASARDVFASRWDAINGKRAGCAWADNPWVWVVSFKCAEAGAGRGG